MQFRLDDHKKELFREESNLKFNTLNSMNSINTNINNIRKKANFFSKILSNINIGIEFNKQIK